MTEAIPGPAYRLQTARLIVRCWEPRDAPLLQAAISASLDHLRPWMLWAANEPQSLQQRIAGLRRARARFDLGEDFNYGIFNQSETEVWGAAGLDTGLGAGVREIGYWVHAALTGRGLATETSAALVRVAFEIDRVDRVEIHCDPANVASTGVPRKLGFRHEATLRERRRSPDGRWRPMMIWSMLAAEYPASRATTTALAAFDAAGRPIPLRS